MNEKVNRKPMPGLILKVYSTYIFVGLSRLKLSLADCLPGKALLSARSRVIIRSYFKGYLYKLFLSPLYRLFIWLVERKAKAIFS